jgi:peroxiredoxin (alkyl hydroperoxide reductase subunit C)
LVFENTIAIKQEQFLISLFVVIFSGIMILDLILIIQKISRRYLKMIRVGKEAPDFKGQAYHKGEFKEVSLSDYEGSWRVVCFYPGDFTFV